MPRPHLPEHSRMTDSALKVRGTPAHRSLWPEVASELRLTEVQLARSGLITLMQVIYQHDPQTIARAAKRANDKLREQGLPTLTEEEFVSGLGLPEAELLGLTFTSAEEAAFDAEQATKSPLLRSIGNVFKRIFER